MSDRPLSPSPCSVGGYAAGWMTSPTRPLGMNEGRRRGECVMGTNGRPPLRAAACDAEVHGIGRIEIETCRTMDSIARLIDHSLLHPTLTDDEIQAGCQLARSLGVASVCVKPCSVPLAAELLRGSTVKVGTVVGFPHGTHATKIKVAEAVLACQEGATELDMVVNVGKVLSGDWNYVRQDIEGVLRVARKHNALLKVIFEMDFLTSDDDKRQLCKVCSDLGVDFVKTSTGFGFVKMSDGGYGYRGATEPDVRLMRAACPDHVQVKAAGGIRDFQSAARMRELGATRLGTSASEAIVSGAARPGEGY